MQIILKILLTLIYPFWHFLAKTWIGNMVVFFLCIVPIPLFADWISGGIMSDTGPAAQSIGTGMAVLSLMCAPFFAELYTRIGLMLERQYKKLKILKTT